MLAVLALAGATLIGYGMAGGKTRNWLHGLGFAAVMAVTVYVILDIEYPRFGSDPAGRSRPAARGTAAQHGLTPLRRRDRACPIADEALIELMGRVGQGARNGLDSSRFACNSKRT